MPTICRHFTTDISLNRDLNADNALNIHSKSDNCSYSLHRQFTQCCRAGAARSHIILVEPELHRDVAPAPAPAPWALALNLMFNTGGILKVSQTTVQNNSSLLFLFTLITI
jgi:uncharacterized membrane protein